VSRVLVDPSHTADLGDGRITVTRWPGGCWAVKVRRRGDDWVAYAVPRAGTDGEPFTIATCAHRRPVERTAIAWSAQASSLACRTNAAVYAGTGDSIDETPLPAGTWYAEVAPAPAPIEPAADHASCRHTDRRCYVHNVRFTRH
jgi:hypothetical protein